MSFFIVCYKEMFYNNYMEFKEQPIRINITSGTIIKTIAIFVLLYFLYLISDILIVFFVSLVFSSALDPWVDQLKKKKIPRSVSVLMLYLIFFSALGLVLYLIIPPIISEINSLANNLPKFIEDISSKFSLLKDYSLKFDIISGYLRNTASGVVFTLFNIFGGIFSFVLILVLTFYMVVEESAMKKMVWSLAPKEHQSYIMHLINRLQLKMGHWLRGQLIVALSLVVLSYAGLAILDVNYALVLALLVGFFSFIPYMGAVLGLIPAVFIAFTHSPWLAVLTAVLFYIIHLIEGNFLQPKIMQKAVGLNPIASILAILAGFKLAGLIGALLAVPATTALSVFIKDIFDRRERKEAAEDN